MNTDNIFALITGASAGIGKAIAFEMADRKINLLLVALPGSGLERVCNELAARFGIRCYGFEGDLTDAAVPARLELWCRAQGYGIRYVINNAGFGNQHSLETSDASLLQGMMALNNQAMVRVTQLLIPHLRKYKSSHLMNVGSLASFFTIPNKAVYSATKSFVYAFSSALRIELNCHGIKVSCLCPGPTFTNAENNGRLKGVNGSRWVTMLPEDVAREAVRKMLNGKKRIIPGIIGKMIFGLWRMLPTSVMDQILRRLFEKGASQHAGNLPHELRSRPSLLSLLFDKSKSRLLYVSRRIKL